MNEDKKKKVIDKINEIRANIESFIADVNINELKSSFNTMIKDAQKDINNLVDRDLENVKKKLQKEKVDLESKAKKFLEKQKKELATLQAKFDKLVKATSKLKGKKPAPTKPAPSKQSVKKKVAKASKKPGFKKTTKKATKKS
ncbi:MAG: hypothetical protein ACLGHN_09725 [Bacteriovoracia bacterium]